MAPRSPRCGLPAALRGTHTPPTHTLFSPLCMPASVVWIRALLYNLVQRRYGWDRIRRLNRGGVLCNVSAEALPPTSILALCSKRQRKAGPRRCTAVAPSAPAARGQEV
jgi:hypothetical protein